MRVKASPPTIQIQKDHDELVFPVCYDFFGIFKGIVGTLTLRTELFYAVPSPTAENYEIKSSECCHMILSKFPLS